MEQIAIFLLATFDGKRDPVPSTDKYVYNFQGVMLYCIHSPRLELPQASHGYFHYWSLQKVRDS
jgi:hypothetical protein